MGRLRPFTLTRNSNTRMSASFSKADVKEHLFRLSPNVCFRPKADVQLGPNTDVPNVCFRESGRSGDPDSCCFLLFAARRNLTRHPSLSR